MKKQLISVLGLLLVSCSPATSINETPASPSSAASGSATQDYDFKPGDIIITTNAACDQTYQCILAKRPEYQATLDTINFFEGEKRVEACNNSLINPLEIVPECTPADFKPSP